ncbi:hypothetical protein C8Q76DRAFT_605551, partial [Earliella scabrosa]
YPPTKEWVVETPEIGEKWQDWCEKRKLRDKREGYFPVHLLDSTKLQHTVKEDASELIVDANTKELLAVVIRSWCAEQPVIDAIAAHIADSPNIQRSARVSFSYLDDPGHLGHTGYTGGSRNINQGLHWAKNLKSAKLKKDAAFIADLQSHESSICAFFWNMALSSLPMQVLQPYQTYLEKHFLPRMAPIGTPYSTHGIYTVPIAPRDNDNPHVPLSYNFDAVPLAPPSATFTVNYARRTHFENCPHKWLISWTLTRTGTPDDGGNFYLPEPEYAVKIESAANSLVAWQPGMWHGTSLRNCKPEDLMKTIHEVGLSFVTSPRLASRWEKYVARNFSAEARAELEEELGDGGYGTDVERNEDEGEELDDEETWW